MTLFDFVKDLTQTGRVTTAGAVFTFEEADINATTRLLGKFHETDAQQMPLTAPAFEPEAATWAAQYLYHAVQSVLLRELTDETVLQLLSPYPKAITPERVYSVDLTLRHLPELLALAKGLAPDDVLVKCLMATARQFPFSSVGLVLTDEPDLSPVLAHPSLRYAYRDKIIACRAGNRVTNSEIKALIEEAFGGYSEDFKADFYK